MANPKFEALVTIESPNGFRARIDLFKLTPRALNLLARVEPRIANDRSFYDQPTSQRLIRGNGRTFTEKSFNIHRPEPFHGLLMTPPILPNDRRFDVGAYGSPRNADAFERWLDGAAAAINEALKVREETKARILDEVDSRIDDWLKRMAGRGMKDIDSVVRYDAAEGWDLRWRAIPMAFKEVEAEGLRRRLHERIAQSGLSRQAWLEQHPTTADLVKLAVQNQPELEGGAALSA